MIIEGDYPDFVPSPQPDIYEIALLFVCNIGITLMAIFFGTRTYDIRYKSLSYSKWLIILLYIDSWAFILSSIFLSMTNNANPASCLAGDFVCIILYGIAKLIIYIWLVERVRIVKTEHITRWKSKTYRFLILIVFPFITIYFVFVLYYFQVYFTPDGRCYIVLHFITGLFVLIYDFIMNFILSMIFVHALLKISKNKLTIHRTSNLQKLAYRSLIAAFISLIASFTNALIYIILEDERGVICFLSCDLDILLNVVVIHWITTPKATSSTITTSASYNSKNIKSIHIASVNTPSLNRSHSTTFDSVSSSSPSALSSHSYQPFLLPLHEKHANDKVKSIICTIDDDPQYHSNPIRLSIPSTPTTIYTQQTAISFPSPCLNTTNSYFPPIPA